MITNLTTDEKCDCLCLTVGLCMRERNAPKIKLMYASEHTNKDSLFIY